MSAAGIVTMAIVAIAVVAIAGYLAVVAYRLNKVSFTVGTVLIGVKSIAYATEPVGTVVDSILTDVDAINAAFSGLLANAELPPAGEIRALPRVTANSGW